MHLWISLCRAAASVLLWRKEYPHLSRIASAGAMHSGLVHHPHTWQCQAEFPGRICRHHPRVWTQVEKCISACFLLIGPNCKEKVGGVVNNYYTAWNCNDCKLLALYRLYCWCELRLFGLYCQHCFMCYILMWSSIKAQLTQHIEGKKLCHSYLLHVKLIKCLRDAVPLPGLTVMHRNITELRAMAKCNHSTD